MIDFYSWFSQQAMRDKPWLVYGKGPSFESRESFDTAGYYTVALNHTIEHVQVTVFHAADIDVVEACEDAIRQNAQWILMPFHPHMACKATDLTLQDFAQTIGVLREFDARGRLVYYDLHSGKTDLGIPRIVSAFSASSVIQLLASQKVAHIRSLGIDGGTHYAPAFSAMADKTLLINGHDSFDTQFPEIEAAVAAAGVDYQPLAEKIRIFVGVDDSQRVAYEVLVHSVQANTRHPVEFFPMLNMPQPQFSDPVNQAGTGFSFNRFMIPRLCGYQGKAIYMDADMLVFGDVAEFWNLEMSDYHVLCSRQDTYPEAWANGEHRPLHAQRHWKPGRQLSVMLLDCAALDWDIDVIAAQLEAGAYTYSALMADLCIEPPEKIGDTIPAQWNCLEWYEPEESKNVHFTVVPTQPWKNDENPLAELWESAFRQAVAANAVDEETLRLSVADGDVKPALLTAFEALQKASVETSENSEVNEAAQLRHWLWASMIRERDLANRLATIESSPAYHLELWLIRKPFRWLLRMARAVKRRLV